MLGHGEHQRPRVQGTSHQAAGAAIQAERVPRGEEEAEQHLEPDHGRGHLGHDEHEALGRRRGVRMQCDVSFDLEQRRAVNQRLGLRVDGVGRVRVRDGGDGPLMLLLLVGILLGLEEANRALQDRGMGPVVGRPLLILLLCLLVLLLARGVDDAIAAFPGNSGAKSYPHPLVNRLPRALHDDVDVIQRLALPGDQCARVGLLESRVLEDGKPYCGCPLDEGMVRVEVQQVTVAPGRVDAEDILERRVVGLCRERLELRPVCQSVSQSVSQSVNKAGSPSPLLAHPGAGAVKREILHVTILIDASVRLMNLGSTSPSSPAASSSAASQSDRTVPTSWAKHSVHVLSAFGCPPTRDKVSHQQATQQDGLRPESRGGAYGCPGRPASESNPHGTAYSSGCSAG